MTERDRTYQTLANRDLASLDKAEQIMLDLAYHDETEPNKTRRELLDSTHPSEPYPNQTGRKMLGMAEQNLPKQTFAWLTTDCLAKLD